MAKQKALGKTRSSKKAPKTAVAKRKKPESVVEKGPATERFVNDLMVRGEAAPLTSNGKLPLEATHVIEKNNQGGSATVRRLRFKLF